MSWGTMDLSLNRSLKLSISRFDGGNPRLAWGEWESLRGRERWALGCFCRNWFEQSKKMTVGRGIYGSGERITFQRSGQVRHCRTDRGSAAPGCGSAALPGPAKMWSLRWLVLGYVSVEDWFGTKHLVAHFEWNWVPLNSTAFPKLNIKT
jgi:hypothetical protein